MVEGRSDTDVTIFTLGYRGEKLVEPSSGCESVCVLPCPSMSVFNAVFSRSASAHCVPHKALSSVSTGCIDDCSLVIRKLAKERVQSWVKSSVELQGDASDSNSPLRFPVLVRLRSLRLPRSWCLFLSCFAQLKSSEELPRRL